MKTLQILRHAKTEKQKIGQKDFDRELTIRGLGQIADLIQQQREHLEKVERILVSPAKRTRMTLEQLKTPLHPAFVVFQESLYLASLSGLIQTIEEQEDSLENILLIGHNNGLSELVTYLTNDYHDLPTSAFVVLEMEINSWKHLTKGIALLKTKYYSNFK
jgi:phosphohistidine phosphatase